MPKKTNRDAESESMAENQKNVLARQGTINLRYSDNNWSPEIKTRK